MKYLGTILLLLLSTSVFADGVPAMNPVQYSGTLYQNNQPYNGPADITLTLYTDSGGANAACPVVQQPATNVQKGTFRFPLSPACVTAIRANSQLYLRLSVDIGNSTVVLPIEKIAASPYTMVADRATSAEPSSVLDQRISALDQRIADLEDYIEDSSAVHESGTTGSPYTRATLELSPGTWIVEGSANVSLLQSSTAAQCGLFDTVTNAPIPGSRGPAVSTGSGAIAHLPTRTRVTVTVAAGQTKRLQLVAYTTSPISMVYGTENPGYSGMEIIQKLWAHRIQ